MNWFLIFVIVIILIHWVDEPSSYDDTDDISNHKRSGLVLYTDHKTGLQYIKAGLFGGLIPRLDKNGKHMTKDYNEKTQSES